MLERSRVLIVFHFNSIMICFYLELIFVYSYSWHSFYYDLCHSFEPSHGLLCVSIPARSDSALIAPISPFILGVFGKLPIPTPTGGPVPIPSPGELVFLMWDVANIACKYFLFSSSLSLLSLTIVWRCQSYNCCVKFWCTYR